MADYDAGDITERERQAANNQIDISAFDAAALKNQLARQFATYDMSDAQNRALRDVQLKQLGRKAETDRFEQARNLQNSAIGLFGALGNTAFNASALDNAAYMLRNRNDADNNVYWQQYTDNANAVRNAYDEALNQNQVARSEAAANAEKGIRDIESYLAANLNNINPNLAATPGAGDANMGATDLYNQYNPAPNYAQLSGYVMPENAEQNIRPFRNRLQQGDYFSKRMNTINRV